MSDKRLHGGASGAPQEVTGVSKGQPSEWSLGKALADAIHQLGSSNPDTPDWLDTYTVTDIGAWIGGVAGFSDLRVTVRRDDGIGQGEGEHPVTRGQSAIGNCRDWYAWHDHEPPGPARLNVTGVCTFPTTGYTTELQPMEPQGINPKDLLMKLVIDEPEIGGAAITDVEVRFQKETDTEYESVTIVSVETISSGGPSIPVQDVH